MKRLQGCMLWQRRTLLCGMLFGMFFLTGCCAAEVEDRNFMLELAIDETTDFGMQWLNQEHEENRVKDYSHLKVIILGKEILEDEAQMEEILALLKEDTTVPRNTYVVAAENAEDLLAALEASGEQAGTYLEQFIENSSQIDKEAYPTLGMFYQESRNRAETLFIPYVTMQGDTPAASEYFVWKRGRAAGMTDTATAFLAAFTANRTDTYELKIHQDNYVKLFDSHNRVETENGRITVYVDCSGELQGSRAENTESVTEAVQQYFNEVAGKALTERGIDVANSYKKLGGLDREAYFFYQDVPESYEQNVDIVYKVQITWVNL